MKDATHKYEEGCRGECFLPFMAFSGHEVETGEETTNEMCDNDQECRYASKTIEVCNSISCHNHPLEFYILTFCHRMIGLAEPKAVPVRLAPQFNVPLKLCKLQHPAWQPTRRSNVHCRMQRNVSMVSLCVIKVAA